MIVVSFAIAAAAAFQSAQAGQPNAMVLAQAHDRCMTGYAVRMTKTAATDETIFAEAVAGCKGLKDQLRVAVTTEYPVAQATELTSMLEAQAKPNFLALLERIRSDRLGRNSK